VHQQLTHIDKRRGQLKYAQHPAPAPFQMQHFRRSLHAFRLKELRMMSPPGFQT